MEQAKKHLMLLSIFIILLNIATNEALSRPLHNPSKHFVLVHGAGHGAWCWYKLVPLLRSSGHNVTTIDLAASGIDRRQISDLQSISDYIRPLRDLLASLPPNEKVILVGHSLGGLALSQTMEGLPSKISVAVFLTAAMPGPSLNISTLNQERVRRQTDMLDASYTFGNGPNNPPTSLILGPKYLLLRLYQLSPIEDWTLATTLMRETRLFTDQELSRDLVLTREKYGSVKRVFIIAEKDLALEKDLQQWMIQKNPPDEVKEIRGSDHMSMMSKPKELWAWLGLLPHVQVWSNDLYWSAEHRVVVNSQRERFSIPFFFFPSQYVDIKPLDELINEQNLAKYKEFNWGKFFASRNRSDYKKREVENIQIDHFKGFDNLRSWSDIYMEGSVVKDDITENRNSIRHHYL
ncbi:hypothetical protein NC652_023689 [Populus alba x Populus x berolinensis]|nr:hypothetical protein NC652_023689 [Populus alba x Populus x berolinensis]